MVGHIPQLEPEEDVPPGKTRLYSNCNAQWPIRPSIYFMKLITKAMASRPSARVNATELELISMKMMKRFPEAEYTKEQCILHRKALVHSAHKLRKLMDLGIEFDESTGLMITLESDFIRVLERIPKNERKRFTGFKGRNVLDILGYVHHRSTVVHQGDADDEVLSHEEYGHHDDEVGDEAEVNEDEEEEKVPEPPKRKINIIIPKSGKVDDEKQFDVEQLLNLKHVAHHKNGKKRSSKEPKAPSKTHELIPSISKDAPCKRAKTAKLSSEACTYCSRERLLCSRGLPKCFKCITLKQKCRYPIITEPSKVPRKDTKPKQPIDRGRSSSRDMTSGSSMSSESDTRISSSVTSIAEHRDTFIQDIDDLSDDHLDDGFSDVLGEFAVDDDEPFEDVAGESRPHENNQLVHRPMLQQTAMVRSSRRVYPPEEIETRRSAVLSMLDLYRKGYFSDQQILEFSKDILTYNSVVDHHLFEGAPDFLMAQILRSSLYN